LIIAESIVKTKQVADTLEQNQVSRKDKDEKTATNH